MSTLKRCVFPLLALLLVAGGPAKAQNCPPLSDVLEKALLGKTALVISAETPLDVASAAQTEASSDASGGSLVNLPGFASLLGLAQEQGLIDRSNGVTAISLTPYSFLALVRPQYTYDQTLYEKAWLARRFGGKIAFGGKGDSFDRDGDGTADEALEAKEPGDIVTWEVKYQFGSRDRRDPAVYKSYFAAINQAGVAQQSHAAYIGAVAALNTAIGNAPLDNNGCIDPSVIQKAFDDPNVIRAVKKVVESDTALKNFQKGFEDVDNRPILTLVYGGTERKDEFGVDKRSAALRGALTLLGGTNTLELSWSEVESLLDVEDAVTWKLGYNYSRSFLKGSEFSKDGLTLDLAGSYEKLQDVPMAAPHDTIGKLNAKLKIPLHEGMEIPISLTWANHKDLLTDEKEIRGHIGFTLDFSKIQEQLLGKLKGSGS